MAYARVLTTIAINMSLVKMRRISPEAEDRSLTSSGMIKYITNLDGDLVLLLSLIYPSHSNIFCLDWMD
ncbi:MAG: hypothetical protein NT007_04535 [Candidatus Kapabacteria bacterium]|nr:hypothetical protein [Candidatus Kapabacteria bacterium]